ncbi:MAG: MFS transporter [Blastocatellia bacterium]|nr:MFS transporter [Blastocatellia bacterium]
MAVSRRYAWYVLFILTLTQLLNYVDRQVVAPLLPHIQRELNLSDTQAGMLGTGFMIVHSLMAIPLGVLADKWDRRKIVSLGLAFWSIATVFSGLASSFVHLLGARAAIGIGEAAYAPAATSMLNDLFPREEWAKVIAIFNAGLFIGGALGLVLGGILVDRIGWQACFFVVGLPGLILAFVNWMVREPERSLEATKEKHDFFTVLNYPALWTVILAAAFTTFSAGALVFWLPKFLGKYHQFSSTKGALLLGLIGISAGLMGVLSGGVVADWLYRRVAGGRALALAIAFLASVPFMVWGIQTHDSTQFLIATFFISYLMGWYHGPVAAIVTDIVPAGLRGTAIAFYMFGIHILGDMPAPVIIGYISDQIGGHDGLRKAFALTILANALAGVLFLFVTFVLRRQTGDKPKVSLPAVAAAD